MTAVIRPAWDTPAAEFPTLHAIRLPTVPDWAKLADPTGLIWEPDGTGRYWQLHPDGSRTGCVSRLGYLLDVHRHMVVMGA